MGKWKKKSQEKSLITKWRDRQKLYEIQVSAHKVSFLGMIRDEIHAVHGPRAQHLIQLDAKRCTELKQPKSQTRNFLAAA